MRPRASSLRSQASCLALLLLTGCATLPTPDHTAGLIQRSDFTAAARAAPGWVSEALHTITTLEHDLTIAENR